MPGTVLQALTTPESSVCPGSGRQEPECRCEGHGWAGQAPPPPGDRGLRPPHSASVFFAVPSFSLGALPWPLRKSQPISWPRAVARPGHVYSSPLDLEGPRGDTREACGRGGQRGAAGTLAKARTGAGLCPGEGVQLIPRAEGRAGGQAEPAGRPAGCVGRIKICDRPYPLPAPAARTSTASSWLRVSHDASQVGTVH